MRSLWIVAVLAGCTDPTTPPCNIAVGIASVEYRDPSNGQCEAIGGYPCDPACGQACPDLGVALPDWGQCSGGCEGLSEGDCLASATCHATYQDDSAQKPLFWGCWELPPTGALTGACTGLDAQTCSEHTDCASLYTGPVNQPPNFVPSFESCVAEPATSLCATVDCSGECVVTPAQPTVGQCEPVAVAGSCTAATCTIPQPGCPTGTTAGVGTNGCYTNYCIPDDECAPAACSSLATEAACTTRTDCDAVYTGTDCTCDHSGCTCQTETYQHCQ